jgi:sulfite oxidase
MDKQRKDEWKLEQGLPLTSGQSIRDQTTDGVKSPVENGTVDTGDERVDDPKVTFAEEYPGKWRGYIEWENYPAKRKKAAEILARHKFPPPPEFQLAFLIHFFQRQ